MEFRPCGCVLCSPGARPIDIQRSRYGLNLLARCRATVPARLKRLRLMALRPGDPLLMQGPPETINDLPPTWVV
jgi:hypothetical protein